MSRIFRYMLTAAAVATATIATAAPASASGVVDPAPIAPNNHFIGQVNAHSATATVKVTCVSPVISGQVGKAAAGQTVDALPVTPPISSIDGYTGSAANSILVSFGAPASTVLPIVLHDWAVTAPIPTTLTLPCSGTGVATFAPAPTSPTARSATVTLTFVAVP